MNIRAWKYEDILRISELEKECFAEEAWSYKTLASVFGTPAFSEYSPRTEERLSATAE